MGLLRSKVPLIFAQLSVKLPQHAMCKAHAMIFKVELPGRDFARVMNTVLLIHMQKKARIQAIASGRDKRLTLTFMGAGERSPSCSAASTNNKVPQRMVLV